MRDDGSLNCAGGKVKHDSRGNALWDWGVATGVFRPHQSRSAAEHAREADAGVGRRVRDSVLLLALSTKHSAPPRGATPLCPSDWCCRPVPRRHPQDPLVRAIAVLKVSKTDTGQAELHPDGDGRRDDMSPACPCLLRGRTRVPRGTSRDAAEPLLGPKTRAE